MVNTMRYKQEKLEPSIKLEKTKVDKDRIAKKVSQAIQIPTVSYANCESIDYSVFEVFQQMLQDQFPLLHRNLEKIIINRYSLLYKWAGSNPTNQSVLYMAHMDVVPIAEGTEKDWEEKPFSGKIKDGFVWGRGTLDTKVTLISSMEAVELLLEEEFKPKEDVYLAFGHDEEIGGKEGALKIVEYLKANNVYLSHVMDEGGLVSEDAVPGVDKVVALIGIGEKGYADLRISVKGEGGHASMPPKSTALGQIAKVISNLEKRQLPLELTSPVAGFLRTIGPELPLLSKMMLANLWLFKPLFMRAFALTIIGNALLRTTTAATMSEASNASNVLPQIASVIFNFRIALSDSTDKLIRHIKRVNNNIPIDIEVIRMSEPSKISCTKSEGYRRIKEITRFVFGDVLVAPYVVLAGTDAIKYEPVCNNIYRFAPIQITKQEIDLIHNTNERISIANLEKAVMFYKCLIMQA